ncbi:MAG: putative selenate reductase subunit YgfK [Treponema sp.]|jgi:putative selenate reductase|nr:putative selenate reductase subunit YgfK [Treponema sp.]
MSEIMRPIPFPDLLRWVEGEYKNHNSIFGIRSEKFYRGGGNFSIFGQSLASPLGPAAGPHSQLAQNIAAAYLSGARFMELKTVQTMDGAQMRKAVSRPCINAMDCGYNVEWSTELTVEEALAEYIKAWFLCHVLAREYGLAEQRDLMFNMSVGYSFEGITSPKIDAFIEGLKDASRTKVWASCYSWLENNTGAFKHFSKKDLESVSPAVSPGITLSTLHGCPREEIEKIASYLIEEKKLNTYIKCNPTLLGYGTARRLLDEMAYGFVSFDDHHFKNDLQFDDAIGMIRRLLDTAKKNNVSFGVKLTNTFPVEIKQNELPGNEMYMSGRSLFPLSINVAKKLAEVFGTELPVSYSGGADAFNLKDILSSGIAPVTVATTLLKPGGYERFKQLALIAEGIETGKGIKTEALNKLAAMISGMKRYRREYRQRASRKTNSELPLFDCAKAPCESGGCPIHQKIPSYLDRLSKGGYREAYEIILAENTAPAILGAICDHQCQFYCTRVDYDDSLAIREAKRIACKKAGDEYIASMKTPPLKTSESAGVIGAGPAGIAAAVFLRRNGVPVTVYEKRERPYGIVEYVIPSFRIPESSIKQDLALAEKTGVEFKFAAEMDSIEELRKHHRFAVIATGAWLPGGIQLEGAVDALAFLEDSKRSFLNLDLGREVVVIGGGDVAMDCARAAKRNRGVEKVSIVYRRTREFMPAQIEEIEGALEDGVEFLELLAPLSYTGAVLVCEQMALGDYDASGRRSVTASGLRKEIHADRVISAVGARVDTGIFTRNGIELDSKGMPLVNEYCACSLKDVYIAGDCRAGSATVVKAIADAKRVSEDILKKLSLEIHFVDAVQPASLCPRPEGTHDPRTGWMESVPEVYAKKGALAGESGKTEIEKEAGRCLACSRICEICVDVCPNRANVMISDAEPGSVEGIHQILHIDRICNECGNCAAFCPHAGSPYREKLTVFSNGEDFMDSLNPGFFSLGDGSWRVRLQDKTSFTWRREEKALPEKYAAVIALLEGKYSYLV